MSSNIQNVISTVFTARSGQALAAMRQYGSGLTGIGQNMQQVGRNSGYMNSQLRAIGTTLRYTFAGTMVFGLARMGQELSDIQTQLALMGTVGQVVDDAGNKIELTDQKLGKMLDNIQSKAPSALTNVNDLAAGVVNFLSSVQNYPEGEVVDTVTRIAQVAQIAQVGTADMTKAVTGMNQAFGRTQNLRNYEQLMRGILHLIEEAPGGISAGGEIIQQLAPLSAVSRLARISPGQMLGGYLTVLRGGGTPSTAGRGFQYLVQSLAQPTKQGLEAQAQAGITPQLVQQRGGMWALDQLMKHARGLGVQGLDKLSGLTDDQLDLIEQGGGAESLGISGPGMQFLREAIGRIHGIRALALLMSQPENYRKDQRGTAGFMDINDKNEKEFADQIEKFVNRQPLKRMTTALVSMRTQIEQDMQPLLNPVAGGVNWVATQGLKHQDATKYGEYGLAGLLGAYGLSRLVRGKGMGRIGAAGPGMLLGVSAIGNQGLGASPQNPMFVVVVGNMFGGGGGNPIFGGRGRGAAGEAAEDAGRKAGRLGRLGRRFGRLGRWGGRLGRFGLPAGGLAAGALTAGIGEAAWALAFPEEAGGGDWGGDPQVAAQHMRHTGNLWRARNLHIGGPGTNVMQLYRAQTGQKIMGKAMVDVDVLVRQPDGKKERKVYHVPMDIWTGGPTPGNRGKHGARR
jgi:hypothetical protein